MVEFNQTFFSVSATPGRVDGRRVQVRLPPKPPIYHLRNRRLSVQRTRVHVLEGKRETPGELILHASREVSLRVCDRRSSARCSRRRGRRGSRRRAVSQLRLFGPQNDEIARGVVYSTPTRRQRRWYRLFENRSGRCALSISPGEHAIAILDPARMTSLVRGTVSLYSPPLYA